MNPSDNPRVAVLPVGEFEAGPVRAQFSALLGAFDPSNPGPLVLPAASSEEAARASIRELPQDVVLLAIVVSRGLSAPIIEAAIRASPVPTLVLPLQGNYALPSSALAIGACREDRLPVELLYGLPDQLDFIQRLNRIVRVARACSALRKSRIGVIGSLFPNLVGSRYDPEVVHQKLGAILIPISFESVRQFMQDVPIESPAVIGLRDEIMKAYSVKPADSSALTRGVQLHLALKQLAAAHQLNAFAAECWYGCPRELGLNPCLGFIEDAYELACEGDAMLCISLLVAQALAGKRAVAGDVYDIDMEAVLTLIHCGGPASLSADPAGLVLEASPLALVRGFETVTCRPRLSPGPVTVFRFYGKDCAKLHLAAGELIHSEPRPNLTVKVQLHGDRSDFLDQCLGNHYVVAACDIRDGLRLLAKWLGITVFET